MLLQELALWNKKYEDKFGHVFLICASGKTSQEVLEAVKVRYCFCW
jgi:2-oxo-4-hydroxy-4-carboxy--5-ureidoimidazoline (OHCU) decarboxylase